MLTREVAGATYFFVIARHVGGVKGEVEGEVVLLERLKRGVLLVLEEWGGRIGEVGGEEGGAATRNERGRVLGERYIELRSSWW